MVDSQGVFSFKGWKYPKNVFVVRFDDETHNYSMAPTEDLAIKFALKKHNDYIGNHDWEYLQSIGADIRIIELTPDLFEQYDYIMKYEIPNKDWKKYE